MNYIVKIPDRNLISGQHSILRAFTIGCESYQGGHVDIIHGVVPYHEIDSVGRSLAEALELAVGKTGLVVGEQRSFLILGHILWREEASLNGVVVSGEKFQILRGS